MKGITYFDILKEAFSITWKNKFLWFFGFLILLGSIGSNLNTSNDNSSVDSGAAMQAVSLLLKDNPILVATIGFMFLVIMIALFLLRILATAGIIRSVNDINLYRQLSIVSILQEARKYLWRLLLLEFLIGFVLVVIVIVLAIPVVYLFAIKAAALAYVIIAAAVLIILPLVILAYYLLKYASFYLVLADEKIYDSLESAYSTFRKNIKESLLMSLVAIASGLLMAIGMMLVLLLLAIAFLPLGLVAYWISLKTGALVILTIASVVGIVCLVTILSWYEAFSQTAWLLFFKQIALNTKDKEKTLERIEIDNEIPTPETV